MSHRLTNDELDEQFELFLKEPVSDDSLDFGGSLKQSTKGSQKPTVPWWQEDDRSGGGKGTAEAKSRFVKAKKSQPEKEVSNGEPFYKPVPKPRSKAVDNSVHLAKTQRDTALKASQIVKKAGTPSKDSSFDSMSTHENFQCGSGKSSLHDAHPSDCDSPFSEDCEDGPQGPEKSFVKSLKKSQHVQEEEEDLQSMNFKREELNGIVFNRDVPKADDSVMVPGMNLTIGLDTLEEEEEKARFFAQLEAGTSLTIDYSKLNKDLDSTTSTIGNNLRKSDKSVEQSGDDDQRKIRDTEAISFTGSPHYSDDFEEEEEKKESQEERSKLSPILAKVSLYDSLDDYGKKNTVGSLDRVLSNVQSGDTEMEALHEAYRQIHVVANSNDHNSLYRPISPSSPPHQTTPPLQRTSTNESELPTEEELMKPIRPEEDYVRGFTLQPVSLVDLIQPSQDMSHIEPQLTQPGRVVTEIKGNMGSTSHQPSNPETLKPDLTWSIREKVKNLMQDHQSSTSHTSGVASKAKKHPVLYSSSTAHPSTSSVRKSTVAPVRGTKALGTTAATPRSTRISRTAAPAKAQPSVSHSPPNHAPKAICVKSNRRNDDTGLKVSDELVASVQSLVTVLHQQIHTSSLQDPAAIQNAEDALQTEVTRQRQKSNRDEGSFGMEELRVQLAEKERQLQMVKEDAEELQSLRQQNFLLQSKLRSAEEESRKSRWANATDPATEDKFQQIDKDMKEQEMLIKGYQQENEKLYLQMKAQQAKTKANEEAMFSENQRLLNELAFTREQLNKTSRPTGNLCLSDHTQRITELLAQVNMFQRNEAKMSEDIHRLKQEKQDLEVDLQLMKKERDLAKAQGIPASGDKTFEMRVLESKHRDEVSALRKKLQWFSENQELLDRDANRLKAATAEIHQLKEQVEQLKMEVSKRSSEQQRKAKVKPANTKRMKDLERQVKELEQVLRHRNPNSLPALIYAAASACQQNADGPATSPPSRSTALLECRIQRLEAELESHDEEAKHSLRAMEQQLQRIKLCYEQRISELEMEQQVDATAAEPEPWKSRVQTLKEELQQLKDTYQEKEKDLLDQIESLQQQLKHKAQSPGRHQRQAEVAFGVRIEHLNQELSVKTRTIQELTRTVARLQKEKTSMPSVPILRPEARSAEPRRQPCPTKTCAEDIFPAAQYEKTYQPTVFTGSHISEVLQENEALRQRVEQLQLQMEQERAAIKADAAQATEELHRLQEHSAEQLSSMKTEHLRVLDQLRTTYTLEHSSSKVAELTNKLNIQEMKVKHLQQQLTQLQGTKDALVISRTREEALQNQLTRLLSELKDAKEAQSSEVKLLCSLEQKLLNMELRHHHREKELQQVIRGSLHTQESNQQSEVERWRRLAQDKSRELEAFRLELDSILDILRHLQRQGAVFPTFDHQQLPRGANTLTDVSER